MNGFNKRDFIAWNLRIAALARRNKDYFWARAVLERIRSVKDLV